MNRMAGVLMAGVLFAVPLFASAASFPLLDPNFTIVPESCQECPCGLGGVLQVAQNLINLAVSAAIIILTLLLAYAGALFMFNATNPEARSQGKKIITNAVVGFLIVLSAWLIIDFIMKSLYDGSETGWGPWNQILSGTGAWCITPTEIDELYAPPEGRVNYDSIDLNEPGTAGVGFSASNARSRAQAAQPYRDTVCAEAGRQGIANQCDRLLAILATESAGKATAQSTFRRKDGSYGHAYGVMQMVPETAREMDPALKGKSDAYIAQALKSNPAYAIQLGVKYYAQMYRKFNNVTYATAAYNAGPGANRASESCSGQTVWQCIENPRYQETRNYVERVRTVMGALGT